MDGVRGKVDGQLVIDAPEAEPAAANAPGPRDHRIDAPSGRRQRRIGADDQVDPCDGERGDTTSGLGIDGARSRTCARVRSLVRSLVRSRTHSVRQTPAMRGLVQRVLEASVTVTGSEVASEVASEVVRLDRSGVVRAGRRDPRRHRGHGAEVGRQDLGTARDRRRQRRDEPIDRGHGWGGADRQSVHVVRRHQWWPPSELDQRGAT